MDSTRFDRISRLFAARRLSRRAAVAASVAAASTVTAHAVAQEATPDAAEPDANGKTPFLFVQSFRGGSIAPKDGTEGMYTVALNHEIGQTVYFSDRPDRIVGAAPTQQFLDGLGFGPGNPPNAALVIGDGEDGTDIAVVELMNPTWHEPSATIVYDVSVLEDFEDDAGLQFEETTINLASIAPTFGSAHLFIDDCMDQHVYCIGPTLTDEQGNVVPSWQDQGLQGMCWNWSTWLCEPCNAAALMQACWDRQVCIQGYPCYLEPRLTPPV